MRKAKLDKIDRKILKTLQDDGRMSNVNLSKMAGISAPPCLRRVRALEANGYITSYHATVDAASMGYNVKVFALVKLSNLSASEKEAFELSVSNMDNVRECHATAGDIDYILQIVARDWDDYQLFLKDHLSGAPYVKSVKSCLSMSTSKQKAGIPIDDQ